MDPRLEFVERVRKRRAHARPAAFSTGQAITNLRKATTRPGARPMLVSGNPTTQAKVVEARIRALHASRLAESPKD